MKIYAIRHHWSYEIWDLIKLFRTREDAEAFILEGQEGDLYYGTLTIEEREVE